MDLCGPHPHPPCFARGLDGVASAALPWHWPLIYADTSEYTIYTDTYLYTDMCTRLSEYILILHVIFSAYCMSTQGPPGIIC